MPDPNYNQKCNQPSTQESVTASSDDSILGDVILNCISKIHQQTPIKNALFISETNRGEANIDTLCDKLGKTTQAQWQALSLDAFKAVAFTSQYDFALLNASNFKSNFSNTELAQVVTRLRDLFAKRVLVLINAEKSNQMLSFGFELLAKLKDTKENEIQLWQFNILTYKQVPDWLNAKYWANPENWDKYRW